MRLVNADRSLPSDAAVEAATASSPPEEKAAVEYGLGCAYPVIVAEIVDALAAMPTPSEPWSDPGPNAADYVERLFGKHIVARSDARATATQKGKC